MARTLDMTIQSDFIEALSRAATIGFIHGKKGVKKLETSELRQLIGVTRWRGGYTAQFSIGSRAIRSAYFTGYENGEVMALEA